MDLDTAHTSPPTALSRALETIKRLKIQLAQQGAVQPIAVVGVGMRFPGGIDDLDGYWRALAGGADLVRPMPPARKARFAAAWDALPHKGGFLDEVTDFDAAFFGISPREARALDPQHRLLLEVACEALENAALPPDRLTGVRTGLYIGITSQDYRDWLTDAPDAYWATGNGHCFAAGRIAYAMGLTGPAIAIDTACSSGLVAVHLACQAVRSGECSLAMAGGVNLVLSPRSTQLVKETRSLAPDGTCKTFDARANGFVRGEGCGVVVLKRLDHALRDGDRVHAVIRGSAVNHDGRSSGFTAPNVLAQIALIEAALADAGLTPDDIGLIEAHGTGTALGDPIEMEALVAALGKKNNGAPLYVGSVKPNLGHLEAAAGIAGLLKVIACCARRAIPALVHHRTLNPRIDLSGTGITLPTSLVPWAPDAGRFAGVSSFGLSGTNAHMIVGAAEPDKALPVHPVSGFALTARTPEALRQLAARFRTSLAALPDGAYGAFAYAATFGRTRHPVRSHITAADRAAALAALDALASGAESAAVTLGDGAPPVAALPRRVIDLPHYPWQRERHAPADPAAASPTHGATSLPVTGHDALGDSSLGWEPRWSRQAINDSSTSAASQLQPAAPARELPALTALLALPEGARSKAMRNHVRGRVAKILGHDQDRGMCDATNFFDLGLDSLMAVDLSRALVRAFGIELAFTDIYEYATVTTLAAAVLARISAAVTPKPAPDPAATVTAARAPRVAFVFSCQGSQYFGMGRELYDTEPVFRARIDACDRILRPLIGVSVKDVMMHGDDSDAIHQTRVTQPATVALQLALADLWTSWGVTASAVFGHSLGEVAAAIHAGVMDIESGLALVAHRGRLMQSTAHGSMLAVKAPLARVIGWLEGTGVAVAAINGPEAVVVSGARDAIDALTARLRENGVTVQPLAVSHASHSPMMEPILPALHEALAGLAFHEPRLPIISNLTGRRSAPGEYDARYWCRQVRETVQFHDAAHALRALDIDVCLEIGPDSTLVNLLAAAGLLPAGGGLASLRRGAGERATMLRAVDALHAQGQQLAWREVLSASGPIRGASSPDRSGLSRSRTGSRRSATDSRLANDRRVA